MFSFRKWGISLFVRHETPTGDNAMPNIQSIKVGTILVSNSNWGPTYVQVADVVNGRFGTYLQCAVLGDRAGEFVGVHSVGPVDMRGIGFKIPDADELRRMASYVSAD